MATITFKSANKSITLSTEDLATVKTKSLYIRVTQNGNQKLSRRGHGVGGSGDICDINKDATIVATDRLIDMLNKTQYEVSESFDDEPYYSIQRKGSHGAEVIYGGDSACEDHYDQDYIQSVYNDWDGILVDGQIEL